MSKLELNTMLPAFAAACDNLQPAEPAPVMAMSMDLGQPS